MKTCLKKVSIITDDDRCSKKNEKDYISKDFDYDNVSSEIVANLENGQPSDRYKELETLCSGTEINIFSAYKTLEYALCCSENNIYHILLLKSLSYQTSFYCAYTLFLPVPKRFPVLLSF